MADTGHQPTRLNPDRYKAFDQDDETDLQAIIKPRRAADPQPAPADTSTPKPPDASTPSAPDTSPDPQPAKAAVKPRRAPQPTKTAKPAKSTRPATKADSPDPDARWSSMAHVNADLIDKIRRTTQERNWSTGEVILTAVSSTYEDGRLAAKLDESGVTTELFGTWRTRVASRDRPPKTPLNFNLLVRHRDVLDQLVEEFNANSRSELIGTALELYFAPEDP